MAYSSEERKRRVLDHVSRTSNLDSNRQMSERDNRKQRVMDHIRRTRG